MRQSDLAMKNSCIGIAGYMGSGKTTLTRFLSEKRSYRIIHADEEAKQVMVQNHTLHKKLQDIFGFHIVKNGSLSFSILGSIVFNNVDKLRQLNTIVHPVLLAHLHKTIFKYRINGITILDGALLPFCNIDDWFAIRIWIDASFNTRLKRQLGKKLVLKEEEIKARMRMQEELFPKPSIDTWSSFSNEGDHLSCFLSVLSSIEERMQNG